MPPRSKRQRTQWRYVTSRYLAVGLEVSLDVFNGRGRRQTTHEHLLGPCHHLTLITVTWSWHGTRCNVGGSGIS